MASLTFLENLGFNGSDYTGTQITANSTAHTKGSYTSLGTSTGAAACIVVYFTTLSQAETYLVDVAADEAGGTSYTTFVENVHVQTANNTTSGKNAYSICLPITFASGTQFAARCQSATGSATLDVHAILYSGTSAFTVSFVESIGADTSTSSALDLDPGGTTYTKTSYTSGQLVASAAGDMDYLIPMVMPDMGIALYQSQMALADFGTGTSGSETTIIGNHVFMMSDAESLTGAIRSYEVDIASGDRVAARVGAGANVATRREMTVSLLGFKKTAVGGGGGGNQGISQGLHTLGNQISA